MSGFWAASGAARAHAKASAVAGERVMRRSSVRRVLGIREDTVRAGTRQAAGTSGYRSGLSTPEPDIDGRRIAAGSRTNQEEQTNNARYKADWETGRVVRHRDS